MLRVVREATPGIRYSGAFFGQDGRGHPVPEAITTEALVAAVESLPAGVTEMACHPATREDHPSQYSAERLDEMRALCDPRVAQALAASGVVLATYAEVGTRLGQPGEDW